jgi:protein SCO1/2
MKKAVASNQWSVVSKRERKRVISKGRIGFFCLLLAIYCPLSFAQGRMYNGTDPLYSPRPELGAAGSGLPAALREVKIEQRLNEQVPLDLQFKDETGRDVQLGEYINGSKPVILSLVFYQCPMLCNQILNGLMASLRAQTFDAGKEFEVLTVSFDPRETPQMAAEKKQSYMQRYNRPGAEKGWHFLTGDQENIRRLTDAVGFQYNYDEKTNQFAHASGIMVMTPGGKLSRYFYGIEYSPRDLRLGLVEASDNRIGSAVDQLLLYCYHYDPATGKYAWVVNIYRWGGGITVLGICALLLSLRRRGNSGNSSGKASRSPDASASLGQGGAA